VPRYHLEVAGKLMQSGVDVLIEKPLATSIAEADELIELSLRYGRIAQAGHLERFNPACGRPFLCSLSPCFRGARLSVFTPRSLDVDVILD